MKEAKLPSGTEKPLPFRWQFFAGAVAGVSEILVMYPLDVAKTRFQLQVGSGGEGAYTSISHCFRQIVQTEGYTRLYRGILPPILVEAPKRAIKFAANDSYSNVYKRLFGVAELTQPLSVLSGMSAGCTEAFAVVSFDLVKIRLQDKALAGKYKGTADAVVKILREEGPLAFFKGLEATIWRHGSWNAGYFGVVHAVRKALPDVDSHSGVLLKNFVAGSIAGTVGTVINTPFDVAKTRIQNQTSATKKYNWTLGACATIAKEEGFMALYKGFLPKVLRLGPGGGILLVVFDQVSSLVRRHWL